MHTRLATIASSLLAFSLFSSAAIGQAYPAKPIRILTAGQGGGLDTVLRLISDGISGPLGQSVVVENRASVTFPQDTIARASPDGYLLGYLANNVWLGVYLRENMPYDPVKDLSPISLTAMIPNILAINSQVPANSVQQLVALAKSKPEEMNMYIAGGGSPTLSTILFQQVTGTKFTQIHYKSAAQGLNDLAAGRLHAMFPTFASALPLAKAGKIKALAVTSPERLSQAPDIPTVSASGYPDFDSVSVHALLAPPKTPPAIVNRLNQEVVKFLTRADIKAKVSTLGVEVVASTPAYLGKFIQSELDRMGPVFKAAGIKPGDMSE